MSDLKDIIAQKKAARKAQSPAGGGTTDPKSHHGKPALSQSTSHPLVGGSTHFPGTPTSGLGLPTIPEPDVIHHKAPSSTGGSMSLRDYIAKRNANRGLTGGSDVGPSASQVSAQSIASLQSAVEAQQMAIRDLTTQVSILTNQISRMNTREEGAPVSSTGRKKK